MKLWLPLLLCVTIVSGIFLGCTKSTPAQQAPYLEFVSLSPDSMVLGSTDSMFLTFKFSDGDGDLGHDPITGNYDIYLKDLRRTNIDTIRYFFPPIPDGAVDRKNGIKGTMSIKLIANTIYQIKDGLHNTHDTVSYDMWIVDRAQQWSNKVTTSPIYLHKP